MPRRIWNDGQEIVFEDLNKIGAAQERELYDRVLFEMLQRVENAFFDGGFLVSYASATSVSVAAGVGFQTDNTQSTPEPEKRLLYRASPETLNLSAPDGSQDRIDIVVVRAARVDEEQESRKFKNASTSVITNENLYTQSDWEAEFDIIEGTPGVSPSAPATPAGWLKIAELEVTAVTGLAGSGAVSDERDLLPIGGDLLLNTLGYVRLTAGATTPISTLLAELDNFIKFGKPNYMDFEDLVSDPSAPASGFRRVYVKGGLMFERQNSGTITPIGSGGGGGGGGANWFPNPGGAPVEDSENNEKVWMFEQALAGSQKLTLFIRVPSSYISGRQIKLFMGLYSPSSSNTVLLSSTSYLVRKNNDAISSTTNSRNSTNAALTNTVANMYREVELDITSATGQINSVSVSAGDLIKVEIFRGSDTDTADLRVVPSSTEVRIA